MPRQVAGPLFFLLAALVFIGIALYQIGADLYQLVAYVPVKAEVTAYVAPDEWAESADRPGRIEYRYTAGGEQYAGKYPAYGYAMPRVPSGVLARPWERGQELIVFVNPSNPAVSTVERVVQPFPFGIITFMLPFCAIGLGVFFPRLTQQRQVAGAVVAGSPGFALWALLSAILAFVYMFSAVKLPWPVAALIGVLLPAAIVPLATWLLLGPSRLAPARGRGAASVAAILAICGLVFLGAGIIVGVMMLRAAFRAHQAACWPVVNATVTRAVLVVDSGEHTSYEAGIRYAYAVHDKTYSGSRWTFAGNTGSREEANARLALHPVGSALAVRYDPTAPGESVVDCSAGTMTYVGIAFGLVLAAVGSALCISALRRWGNARRSA